MASGFGTRVARIITVIRDSGLDSVVLLIAGVALALLSILGIANIQLTLSIATALLSMVGALLLRSEARHGLETATNERLARKVDHLLTVLEADADVAKVLAFEYPDFRDRISDASQVDVVAALALNVINQYLGTLNEAITNGAQVRLLCADPADDGVVQHAIFRSTFRTAPRHVTDDVTAHLQFAESLAVGSGSVQVRTVPYLPTMGMVRIKGPGNRDEIFVKLIPFRVAAGQYPTFRLDSRSGEWFDYFAAQIDSYFSASLPHPVP